MAIRFPKALQIGMLIVGLTSLTGRLMYGPRAWERVDRAALGPDGERVFGLIVALHGKDGGRWREAEQLCRSLGWPRCDRAALEEVERKTRPPHAFHRSKFEQEAAAQAVADATWAFGSEDAARKMFRVELDRIPESNGPARARVFLRFGIVDPNPDGQAALFAQACVADASLCELDKMKEAAKREVQARFVPPGNVLPLYFGGGHPPIAGQR